MRQIVLDTETTGLEPQQGHRIIEIGCVELVDRQLTGNNFHQYLQPDRDIDPGAVEVHGITNEFLAAKPRFADVVDDLIGYLKGAELVIHNAAFDVSFLDHELSGVQGCDVQVNEICSVLDTLAMARRMHPGQRNSLDALCARYQIDSSRREKHGALLDAEILADVYLAMTGGQVALSLDGAEEVASAAGSAIRRLPGDRQPLLVVRSDPGEQAAHEAYLDRLDEGLDGVCAWRRLDQPA